MPIPQAPPVLKDSYRLELPTATGWRSIDEQSAIAKLNLPESGRYRILHVSYDKAKRRHFDVIKEVGGGNTLELEPAPTPLRTVDRLVYEPDGNVLSARSRR